MKPIDPDRVPQHISAHRGGKTGLVHGPAPDFPRAFDRLMRFEDGKRAVDKQGRRGRKARARAQRALQRRFG
jgi:hypothetical protein